MATLKQVNDVVMKYAEESKKFTTPSAIIDPIQPSIASLTDESFNDFYFSLLEFMARQGLQARVPIAALKACRIWRDISMLILHFQ